LRLGRVVCDGLGIEGLGFRRVAQRLVRSEAHPTTTEATAFVRSAVRNLCQSTPAPSRPDIDKGERRLWLPLAGLGRPTAA
jgi:hypothetical protein